jgi:hypothetical protein
MMSYEIPSEEKDKALKSLESFTHLQKLLKECNDRLNLIYTPFKNNTNITPEQTYKARASLRIYRDRTADRFNELKQYAFKCFISLQPFSSDTQIVKLKKSFVFSVDDIQTQVNRFLELFSSLDSNDFGKAVITAVENIQKEISQLEQIVEARIKNYIQSNILARSWVDDVSDELQQKVETKIPLSIELVNQRTKELENKL